MLTKLDAIVRLALHTVIVFHPRQQPYLRRPDDIDLQRFLGTETIVVRDFFFGKQIDLLIRRDRLELDPLHSDLFARRVQESGHNFWRVITQGDFYRMIASAES